MDGGRETLGHFVTNVWARALVAHLAPATREYYSYLYDSYIGPAFGDFELREISSEAIATWQAGLLEAGLGKPATKKAITLLGNILQRAAESGRIPANPQRIVRKVRVPRSPEVEPLAPSTVERMRRASGPRDATLISVLAYAGLRPGEALGLRWSQVRDRTLIVNAEKTGARRSVRLLAPSLQIYRSGGNSRIRGRRLRLSRRRRTKIHQARLPVVASEVVRLRGRSSGRSEGDSLFPSPLVLLAAPGGRPEHHRGRSPARARRQSELGTYGHVIDELAGIDRVDAEEVIWAVRAEADGPVSYLSA